MLAKAVPLNRPLIAAKQLEYLGEASSSQRPWGGGKFYSAAKEMLTEKFDGSRVFITQSGTAALELAFLALGLSEDDEVIVPSYTFVTTASSFALRGARPVFVDVLPDSLNIDPEAVRRAITSKTRAVVVVHYGGVPADMERLLKLRETHGFVLIEDAAQAFGSSWNGQPLGLLGDYGCISFHGTKNVSAGEGGLLVVSKKAVDAELIDILHEKGTDRSKFLSGAVDKYTWRALGSSFIPSEFTCAVLLSQLEQSVRIEETRRAYWDYYSSKLSEAGISLPVLENPPGSGNSHMFAFLAPNEVFRASLIEALRTRAVEAAPHYEPLHQSPYIQGQLGNTLSLPVSESVAKRVLRLPMWSDPSLDLERVWASLEVALETASKLEIN